MEGILIRKNLYQDRHIIGNLLLRNGKTISVIFYGAQPGSSSKKSKILDIGCLYQITSQPGKKYSTMMQTREWIAKWSHQSIRLDFKKYSVLCFGLELISKICIEEEASYAEKGIFTDEFKGSYKVISNFLFELEKNDFTKEDTTKFLIYFLGKLFIELGIFPDLSSCQITGENLNGISNISLRADLGGFVLNSELEDSSLQKDSHFSLRQFLDLCTSTKWNEKKWSSIKLAPKSFFHDLLDYLSFQLNINLKTNLKSYGSLVL